jgi:hypothetical protein
LLRTRNQIERHRRRTQNQIKSLLLFHGKHVPASVAQRICSNALLTSDPSKRETKKT